MKTDISHSVEETRKIAEEWLVGIMSKRGQNSEALVVGLSGHLGAGKTAFTKAVASLLGVKEVVTSPTFVIMKIYELSSDKAEIYLEKSNSTEKAPPFPWTRLVHIDAYRLERTEELEALDFEGLVANSNNLIMVEWPENVGMKAPVRLSFRQLGQDIEISH